MLSGIGFHGGERVGDAGADGARHVGSVEVTLGALCVFLAQHVEADLLPGERCGRIEVPGSGLFMGAALSETGVQ